MSLAFSLGGERAARVPAVESPPTTVPVQAHSPPSSPSCAGDMKRPAALKDWTWGECVVVALALAVCLVTVLR